MTEQDLLILTNLGDQFTCQFLGMGPGNDCHHPAYRFNDNILSAGASYWVKLAEKSMPAN